VIEEEMSEEAKNIIITSMEIALMILSDDSHGSVREGVLEMLDISDEEADILEQNLEMIMEAKELEVV